MAEVLKALEFAGTVSWAVIALLIVAALVCPAFNEWIKRKLAGQLELQKARLDLASDYYTRRLETYLRIWKITQDAIRGVINAANPHSEVTWDQAKQNVADLKNAYWDARPLLSSRVHVCVRRVSSFFDRAIDQPDPSTTSADARYRVWGQLIREVKAIQGALLNALAEDLQHSGLSGAILGAPGEDPGEPPTGSELDAALTRLVRYVGDLETKLPYVGRSYVTTNFYRAPALDVRSLIDFAVSDGLLEEYEAQDATRSVTVAALRVNKDSAQALEMLDEDVRKSLCGTS